MTINDLKLCIAEMKELYPFDESTSQIEVFRDNIDHYKYDVRITAFDEKWKTEVTLTKQVDRAKVTHGEV